MKDFKQIKRKYKSLGIKDGNYLIGLPVTEEQHNEFYETLVKLNEEEFYKKYLFYPTSVLMLGNVNDKSRKLMDLVIDSIEVNGGRSYTCFAPDWKRCIAGSTVVIHESIDTSWNCLIEHLGYPKFAIILKFNKEEYDLFTI